MRSRYLKGVVPLIGGEIDAAAKVAVSKKGGPHAGRIRQFLAECGGPEKARSALEAYKAVAEAVK